MKRRTFLRRSAGAAAAAAIGGPRLAFGQPAARLRVAITGDNIMTRRVSTLTNPDFLAVRALLQDADCAIGNCEAVIARKDEGVPTAGGRSLTVVVDPLVARELSWMGYDLMGTANNHSIDYGVGGIAATLRHLDNAGVHGAGTGMNLQEAAAPRYAETAGGRVALVGCASTVAPGAPAVYGRGDYLGVPGVNAVRLVRTYQLPKPLLDQVAAAAQALAPVLTTGADFPVPPGVTFMGATIVEGPTADLKSLPHPTDAARIEAAATQARHNARLAVVSIHAHEIYRDLQTPDPFLRVLARGAIDAGANVWMTHGSHFPAGIEIYKGAPIFYGLGDFFFQYETVPGFAADVYEAYGLEPFTSTPDMVAPKLPLKGGRLLWETFIPVLDYDGDRLKSLALYPVTLGMEHPVSDRGTPVLASPADAERIVSMVATLSKPYGTEIAWDARARVGRVRLA